MSRPHDPYAAFRHVPYRWFIVSLFTMTLATQVQAVVVGWQIYALTKDPLALGLIGLAEVLPFVSFALYAGHVADARDRRRVSLVSLGVLLACAVALLAMTRAQGFLTGRGPWPIYAVIFLSGVARSFLQPARSAMAAELVPRAQYTNAVAWRSSTWQAAAVGGPALGGLLYGFTSADVAYLAVVALMVVGVAAFMVMRYQPLPRTPHAGSVLESLASGVRFVRHQPVILGAMSLDLFSVFLAGSEALLPVFAAEILHVGPQGLGVLRAAPAAGAVLTSVWLAHRPPMQRAGRDMLLAVALFACCIIGFGLSRSFVLSLLLLAVSGMADNVSVVIRSTLLQTMTPPEMLGRVSSVNQIFIGSSNELGAFESGVAARLLGTVPAVVLGGIASLGVVGVVAAKVPALRRLRELA
ncbi:MAG TPA: MFS transporter [Gemmatimonadaceae bacterium]|nr:MFS transporter [Gemmatimonadaceae bacterium]